MIYYTNKLYKLAGVQKGFIAYKDCYEHTYTDMPIYSGEEKFFTSYEQAEKECYFIPYYVKADEEYYFEYPEFTAEKQLKLLLLFNRDFTMIIDNQDENSFSIHTKQEKGNYSSTFAEAIAETACEFLEKRYYDKSLIKEILEQ